MYYVFFYFSFAFLCFYLFFIICSYFVLLFFIFLCFSYFLLFFLVASSWPCRSKCLTASWRSTARRGCFYYFFCLIYVCLFVLKLYMFVVYFCVFVVFFCFCCVCHWFLRVLFIIVFV